MLKFSFKKYVISAAAIGLLIFFHFLGILSSSESLISRLFNPVLKNFYSLGSALRSTYNDHANKQILNNKIKQLENQSNELIIENVKLKILEKENQILRQNLKFFAKNQYHYKMANIISRDKNQMITIDKGSADGLSVGLPIISPDIYNSDNQRAIVGKITEIKENLSEVCLLNNQNCKLACSLSNQTKTNGVVHGELGLTVKMEFIRQMEKIDKNDIVITSGLEQNIPQGLVIGKIIDIAQDSNELWQSATVEPLINFDNLTIVSVLLP